MLHLSAISRVGCTEAGPLAMQALPVDVGSQDLHNAESDQPAAKSPTVLR